MIDSALEPLLVQIPCEGTVHITEAEPMLKAKFEQSFTKSQLSSNSGTLDVDLIPNKPRVQILCITVRSKVGKEVMDALPSLKIIATGSTGVDHIDLAEARLRGIAVCNVPEYGSAVAEFNIAMMMMLSRRLHTAFTQTNSHNYSIDGLLGRNLEGRTLGIVGTGHIGLQVAQLASAMGLEVVAYDPEPKECDYLRNVSLDELFKSSDIISICCPLTPKTTRLVGKAEFNKMKRGVLLVNTSRGEILNSHDLVWALDEGIVDGAALDVLEGEVLLPPKESTATPKSDSRIPTTTPALSEPSLLHHPRVIVTPHMAYYTEDSLDRIRQVTLDNVVAFLSDHPQNLC